MLIGVFLDKPDWGDRARCGHEKAASVGGSLGVFCGLAYFSLCAVFRCHHLHRLLQFVAALVTAVSLDLCLQPFRQLGQPA